MFVVTGANGFIGSVMVWELNQAGYTDILAVDSVSREERPEPLKKVKIADFISSDQLFDYLSPERCQDIECIFHMGACSSTTETDEEFLKRNNTEYSQKLFEICRDAQIPYIYASSGAVYGNGSLGFSDQKDPAQYKPLNLYGWSKANFDVWATRQDKTPPVWYGLRFFNVYGPNEYHKGPMRSVVHKAFEQIKDNGQLKLFRSHRSDYEDGKQMRDFVYVKDITRWMLELYKDQKAESGIYNMGYGQARTWLDLAENVFTNMKQPFKIDWMDIPENIRDQYQYYTEAEMGKLLSQGLSEPQWPLEKGIKDYVSNYLMSEDPFV